MFFLLFKKNHSVVQLFGHLFIKLKFVILCEFREDASREEGSIQSCGASGEISEQAK